MPAPCCIAPDTVTFDHGDHTMRHITVVRLLHRDTYLTDPDDAVSVHVLEGTLTAEDALDQLAQASEGTDDAMSPDDLVMFHDVFVTHHIVP